ncbi:peroxiredoxin-like family protein [Dyella subtropica]|uniref:peroxiredoxin-like family protein n=1 Tax=Dyella subtropica TaxID=2992127 RepID=UPI002255359D|nr:peroxiredoxin-like family protein [Dyella subtropica]
MGRPFSLSVTRLAPGDMAPLLNIDAISGARIAVPNPTALVHLQFRRFAGCPVCKLHLRDIGNRHDELARAGIKEVAVFHSSHEALVRHQGDLPFHLIADPSMALYRKYRVESSLMSVLHPRAWTRIIEGLCTYGFGRGKGEPAFGLPADFMVSRDGRIIAVKYGIHADDHWSVEEVLSLAVAESAQAETAAPNVEVEYAPPRVSCYAGRKRS